MRHESMTAVARLQAARAPGTMFDDGELVEILTLSAHTANSSSIVFTHTGCYQFC